MNYPGISPGLGSRLVFVLSLLIPFATAQQSVTSTYSVAPKAMISITNNYGPITVKPSGTRQIVAQSIARAATVTFENEQRGNRVELTAHSKSLGDNLAEYVVLVPSDSWLVLKSSTGKIHVQELAGDLVLETATGAVEVAAMSSVHVHVKTLGGPVAVTGIRSGHLDVHTVGGNVSLRNVAGSSVQVRTSSGRISYEGDPGLDGDYQLTSHSGDLEISVPAKCPALIRAVSLKGNSDKDFPEAKPSSPAKTDALLPPGLTSVSRLVLRSFSGKIHLKRP